MLRCWPVSRTRLLYSICGRPDYYPVTPEKLPSHHSSKSHVLNSVHVDRPCLRHQFTSLAYVLRCSLPVLGVSLLLVNYLSLYKPQFATQTMQKKRKGGKNAGKDKTLRPCFLDSWLITAACQMPPLPRKEKYKNKAMRNLWTFIFSCRHRLMSSSSEKSGGFLPYTTRHLLSRAVPSLLIQMWSL